MVQIMEAEVQKKQQMKVTMDRMSDLSPFECMFLCGVDGTTCYMDPSGYEDRAEEVSMAKSSFTLNTIRSNIYR